MKKLKVIFSVQDFWCAWGRFPRGKRQWCFGTDLDSPHRLQTPEMNYGAAKRWVIEQLLKAGVTGKIVVKVLTESAL